MAKGWVLVENHSLVRAPSTAPNVIRQSQSPRVVLLSKLGKTQYLSMFNCVIATHKLFFLPKLIETFCLEPRERIGAGNVIAISIAQFGQSLLFFSLSKSHKLNKAKQVVR